MGRKYGQHFMVQHTIIDRLVEVAQIEAEEWVLEVGAGKGALTQRLLAKNCHVIAIEIDENLIPYLKKKFATRDRLTLLTTDILSIQDSQLLEWFPTKYKIVANLPYHISTPILFQWLPRRKHLHSISIVVQKEVAQRICALPKDKKIYGSLSVASHLAFECRYVMTIPPNAFLPAPKVESAMVHLTPKSPQLDATVEKNFLQWVKQTFQFRRKTLSKSLRSISPVQWNQLSENQKQVYGKMRIEELHPDELQKLYLSMYSSVVDQCAS